METWDRATAQKIADYGRPGVVVWTSLGWLQHINAKLKDA